MEIIKNIIMSLILALIVSGCLFHVKEMVIDPDKGVTHAEEDNDGLQKQVWTQTR